MEFSEEYFLKYRYRPPYVSEQKRADFLSIVQTILIAMCATGNDGDRFHSLRRRISDAIAFTDRIPETLAAGDAADDFLNAYVPGYAVDPVQERAAWLDLPSSAEYLEARDKFVEDWHEQSRREEAERERLPPPPPPPPPPPKRTQKQNEEQICRFLRRRPDSSLAQVEKSCKEQSKRQVIRNMRKLEERGVIAYQGVGAGAKWRLYEAREWET